jgi:FkbM family methyltransferase
MFSSSQYAQDIYAYTYSGGKENFFVEVGGYDPFLHSNSYWLESKHNWTGLCIEPDPVKAKKIQESRTASVINKAISDKEGSMDFVVAGALSAVVDTLPKEHFSRIKRENPGWEIITVSSAPFGILEAMIPNNKISYLSIDVEGHELNVIRGIDFSKIEISIITVEFGVSGAKEILSILKSSGFIKIYKHHGDYFFINKKVLKKMSIYSRFSKRIKMTLVFLANDFKLIFTRAKKIFD